MSKTPEWMQGSGFGGKHMKKAKEESQGRVPLRFWLNKGTTKEILFLDDEPKFLYEHRIKTIGKNGKVKWREFTCRRGMTPGCPYCLSEMYRSYIGFLTVLDLTGYRDERGDEHTNIRKLFAMGLSLADRFARWKKKKDGLTGWIVECVRNETNSNSALGDDFEFVKRIPDLSKAKEYFFTSKLEGGKAKPSEPYDYATILAPHSVEEMKMIQEGLGEDTSSYSSTNKSDDDDDDNDEGGDGDAVY